MSRPNISYPQPIHPNNAGPLTYPSPHQAASSSFASTGMRDAGGRRTSVQSVNSVGFRQPSGPRPGPNALDSSITRLLVVTKQLLQCLEQWAHGAVTENDVSDIYVRLGDIFDTCITSFNRAGISTRELISIPLDLRRVLEEALAEEASQESLNLYLPTIRQIIYNLLDGLKRKQAQYKRSLAERQDSIAYGGGGLAAPSQALAHSQSLGRLEGAQAQPNPAGRQGSFGSMGASRPIVHSLAQSQTSMQGGLGQGMMEDDRLSVSARSAVSVGSYHSNTSNPNLVQPNQQASGSSSNLATKPPSAHSSRRASPSPTPDDWEKRIPKTALAERERERAQRSNAQRPAPPDAFRPPRRIPSDGTAGTMRAGVPSPQPPPNAPLPAVPTTTTGPGTQNSATASHGQKSSMRGVQLKDDGPLPSPPPSAASLLSNPQPPALPPKAPARENRYSYNFRDRDSLGNPKPVSRFSADSDITSMTHGTIGTNGSPVRSPPSKSPPASIAALAEHADEDDRRDNEEEDGVLRSAGRMTFGQRIAAPETSNIPGRGGYSDVGEDGGRASFGAGRDAPSLPKLDLPNVSLLDSSMSLSSRADDMKPSATRDVRDPMGYASTNVAGEGGSSDLPPEAKSTLATLRTFDTLERRASKRFSSYTLSKMLPSSPSTGGPGRHARKPSGLGLSGGGDSPQRPARRVQGGQVQNGVPAMPPLPEGLGSAGSSAREKYAADGVSARDKVEGLPQLRAGFQKDETSPYKSDVSTGSVKVLDTPPSDRSRELSLEDDDDQPLAASRGRSGSRGGAAETKTSSFGDLPTVPESASTTGDPRGSMSFSMLSTNPKPSTAAAGAAASRPDCQFRSSSATPTHCTVYLQFGRQSKKARLEYPITAAGIKMLFMERFEYDPGMDDFPEVYVMGNTGVAFELEDVEDVVEGCVLSLNIEPLDQVKQHFDHTFASLIAEIKEMKSSLDRSRRISVVPAQTAALLSAGNVPPVPSGSPGMRSSPRLGATASPRLSPSIGSANANPLDSATLASGTGQPQLPPQALSPAKRVDLEAQQTEILSLRRDLAIMRQLHSDFLSETKTAFTALKTQNNAMKEVINTKTGGSRALLDNSKTKLENASSDTITAVEEIQDLIDAAKDDAQRRFAIPSNATMKKIRRDLAKAEELAEGYRAAVHGSEQMWRATWAHELQRVMEEQKLYKYQTTLGEDLRNDVRDAKRVWASVEEFVEQRIASGHVQADGGGSGTGTPKPGQAALRTPAKGLISQGINFRPPSPTEGSGMPHLLREIRSKESSDPNQRLKAIEAQARAREREKADKLKEENEFADELGEFVNKKKLKKTGGTEEVERMRSRKQEVVLRRMITGENTPAGSRNVTPTPVSVKKEPVSSVTAGAGTSVSVSAPVSARQDVEVKKEPDTPGSSSAPATASIPDQAQSNPEQTTPKQPDRVAPSVQAMDPDNRPIKAEIDTPSKPGPIRDVGEVEAEKGQNEAEKRLLAEHEEVFGSPLPAPGIAPAGGVSGDGERRAEGRSEGSRGQAGGDTVEQGGPGAENKPADAA